jgi:RNase P subunit RPR2
MYTIQQKSLDLNSFEEKICPKCKSSSVSSQKLNSNCCGVQEYLFECDTCGYKDRYNLKSSHSSCVNYMKKDEVYEDIDPKSIKV